MRRVSVELQIPFLATLTAPRAAVKAVRDAQKGGFRVGSLTQYFAKADTDAVAERVERVA